MKKLFAFAVLCGAVSFVGCGKPAETKAPETPATTPAAEGEAAPAPAAEGEAAPAPAAEGEAAPAPAPAAEGEAAPAPAAEDKPE